MYPPSLSHFRAGVMMPGIVTTKVTKIMTAFAIPAAHVFVSTQLVKEANINHRDKQTLQGKPLVQQIPRRLLSLLWNLKLDFLDDDREGEHEDAHEQKEPIADHVGQEDLVRHRDFVRRVGGLDSDDSSRDDRLFSLPLYLFDIHPRTAGVYVSLYTLD